MKTSNSAISQSLISGATLTIGFIGWRAFKGYSLNIEDIMVGLLFGIIVGLLTYIFGTKKTQV